MEDPLLRDAGGMANGTAKAKMTVAVEDTALAASVDAAPVKTVRAAWDTFMAESARLWLIAMPIAFQTLCVYGINSATQIFVGHLSNLELSAVAVSLSVVSNFSFGFLGIWIAMLFIGINAAISVRVSNELGSGRARGCKHAVVVVVVTSLVIGLLAMVVILGSRNYFSVIFTSDKEMQRAVAKIAYLLAVTMVLNSVQPVISGVAIGGGWQGLVAYINLGCYYVFGLPFGFLLGYPLHLGVQGIWIGMLCGTLAQTLILVFILMKTNWKDEASQASERVRLWGGQNEPTKSS